MFNFLRRSKGPAVYTLWKGARPAHIYRCLSTVANYAKRHGLSYHHVELGQNDKVDMIHPAWAKYNVLERFLDSKHDRMLFVDSDIWVRETAPNIFEELQGNWMRRDPIVEQFWPGEFEEWTENHYKMRIVCPPYFNTGVMLLDKRFAKKLLKMSRKVHKVQHGTFEQHHVNVCIRAASLENDLQWLKSKWNWICCNPHEHKREEERHFDHFASPEGKQILIKQTG